MAKNKNVLKKSSFKNIERDTKSIADYARFQMTMATVGITLTVLLFLGVLLFALLS